jgi:signal peptidase I
MKTIEQPEFTPPTRSLMQRAFFGGNTRNTIIRAGVFILFCAVLFGWVLRPIRVTGISMLPTYADRSLNFVNLLSYKLGEPQRGDVVSIGRLGDRAMLMKRIIVLPGETYSINNGVMFVDGEPLNEPYVKFREKWQSPPRTLGASEYLVIGDNRGMEMEAHYFGVAERPQLLGKILF